MMTLSSRYLSGLFTLLVLLSCGCERQSPILNTSEIVSLSVELHRMLIQFPEIFAS
jgi:hypothetical protein